MNFCGPESDLLTTNLFIVCCTGAFLYMFSNMPYDVQRKLDNHETAQSRLKPDCNCNFLVQLTGFFLKIILKSICTPLQNQSQFHMSINFYWIQYQLSGCEPLL